MFAYFKGLLQELDGVHAVINVSDVGYAVLVPASYNTKMRVGAECALHIATVVREDHIALFGFLTREEKHWFGLLCDVQGVGGKLALATLSLISCDALAHAIKHKDCATLKQVSGLGGRIAERIVSELYDKIWKLFPNDGYTKDAGDCKLEEVYSALEGLGYKQQEVRSRCEALYKEDPTISSEKLIYAVLQGLGRS